jgi:hypothetical protein
MGTPEIDFTLPLETKDGLKVRILCTDRPGETPVVGIIEDDFQSVCQWYLDGTHEVEEALCLRNALKYRYVMVAGFELYARFSEQEDNDNIVSSGEPHIVLGKNTGLQQIKLGYIGTKLVSVEIYEGASV